MQGFVKVPRELLDWEWRGEPNTLALYIIILLRAQWGEGCYKGVELKRGQLVTTVAELSRLSGLTTRQTRTALDHLRSTDRITIKTTNRFSIITLNERTAELESNRQNN